MSLLQSPERALNQIEWYLENRTEERFPGAFLLAAGNLCRQTLEQILFILAFYSGMPRNRYLRSDGSLQVAGRLLAALKEQSPGGKTYYQLARKRGSRIRKFARYPRTLNKWRRLFNEPSHFRNPAARPRARERHIRDYVQRVRSLLESGDEHLIVAAFNELRSNGVLKAVIGPEPDCAPGLEQTVVVGPEDFVRDPAQNKLALVTPPMPYQVVPRDQEVRHQRLDMPIVLVDPVGMIFRIRMVTRTGRPVDISSLEAMIASVGETLEDRLALQGRFQELGYTLEFSQAPTGSGS